MSVRTNALALVALSVLAPACNPYGREGDFYAGPVDPSPFLDPYKGAGFAESEQYGTFVPFPALVGGQYVGFFAFPATADDVLLKTEGLPELPLAYVFDPGATEPIVSPAKCKAPENYVFDQQRDFVRFDEQGNIVTALPTSPSYRPLYAEVKVTTNGTPCQTIKGHEEVVQDETVSFEGALVPAPAGSPPPALGSGPRSGKFVAWAVIDPAADVLMFNPDDPGNPTNDPITGLGPQRWGWFDHYLLAYLDGGYVPTTEAMIPDGMGGMQQATVAVTQNLYIPSHVVDAMGMVVPNPIVDEAGNLAPTGFEVLDARRGQPGYSPICQVQLVDTELTAAAGLPTDASQIDPATVMPPPAGIPSFIYCLQTE